MNYLRVHGFDGDLIHYSVYGQDGNEIKEARVPFAALQEEALDLAIPWMSLLAEREGANPYLPEMPEAPEGEPVRLHWHEEFAHAHELIEHEHDPHEHELQEHDHPLKKHLHDPRPYQHEHDYELPPHGHNAISTRLEALEQGLEGQQKHRHPPQEFPHGHEAEFQAIYQRLATWVKQIQEILAKQEMHQHSEYQPLGSPVIRHIHPEYSEEKHRHGDLEKHEHEAPTYMLPEHEHRPVEHGHPELWGKESAPEAKKKPAKGHLHRFDTMLADGKGYRCGVCGIPKLEVEKSG